MQEIENELSRMAERRAELDAWAADLRSRPKHPSLMDFSRWITVQHEKFKARFPTTMRRISTADRDDFERFLEAL